MADAPQRGEIRVRPPRWYHLDESGVNSPLLLRAALGIFMLARYGLFDRPQEFRGPSRVWFGAHAASRINECVQELALRPHLSVSYIGKSWAGRSPGH
jgi:hypothetical protein